MNHKSSSPHPGHELTSPQSPLTYLTAALFAVPIGAVIWFELVYLWFGLTGRDPAPVINIGAFLFAVGLALGVPLRQAQRPAQVVQRSCRLGLVVSLLLPIVTIAVLLLWERSTGRPDLGMGGLMLYNMPIVAFVVTLVLSIIFSLCSQAAARRLKSH